MLTLALEMAHLEAFIHISTAFSNCTEYHIEEKVYDQPLSATNAMKLSECLDEKTLLAIEPKYEVITKNKSTPKILIFLQDFGRLSEYLHFH